VFAVGLLALQLAAPLPPYELGNGLRVVLHPDDFSTDVAVLVRYDVGRAHDPDGYENLAHLVEHLTFTGTKHLPGLAMAKTLAELGGDFNAHTLHDHTRYFVTAPARELPVMLWIEAERMAFALESFDAAKVEREIAVVAREQDERKRIYGPWIYSDAHALIAEAEYPPGHLYARGHSLANEADGITLANVQWFFQRYYRPDNATLVITGNFDPERARTLVADYFEAIGRPPAPVPRDVVDRVLFRGRGRVRVRSWLSLLPLRHLVWHLPCDDTEDRAIAYVAHAVLEHRLRNELANDTRTRFRLDLGDRGNHLVMALTLGGHVVGPSLDERERAVQRVLVELWEAGPDRAELVPMSVSAQTDWLLEYRTLHTRAQRLATSRAHPPPDLLAIQERMKSVTVEDVRQLFAHWIRYDRMLVADEVLELSRGRSANRIDVEELDDFRFVVGDKRR
jgi:zinc protease